MEYFCAAKPQRRDLKAVQWSEAERVSWPCYNTKRTKALKTTIQIRQIKTKLTTEPQKRQHAKLLMPNSILTFRMRLSLQRKLFSIGLLMLQGLTSAERIGLTIFFL